MNRQFLSVVGLTVTHLKQVTDRLPSFREEDLLRLDQAVNSYLLRRREGRDQEGFQLQMQAQLAGLERKNDYLAKELDILTYTFEQEQQRVASGNQKWLRESEELIEAHPFEQLCRELITELASYRQIAAYASRLEQLRKEGQERHFVNSNLQEFIEKMDEIMKGEEQEGVRDYYQ